VEVGGGGGRAQDEVIAPGRKRPGGGGTSPASRREERMTGPAAHEWFLALVADFGTPPTAPSAAPSSSAGVNQ
jgi:hypothetical protein